MDKIGTMILVWPFEDAPKDLQKLSTNGGDEDWLALVPDKLHGLSTNYLKANIIDIYPAPEKYGELVKVWIGAHA